MGNRQGGGGADAVAHDASNALELAVSPLTDDRIIGALVDLHSRGIDVALLEVVPLQTPSRSPTFGPLTERLWRTQRRAARSRLLRLGVPVTTWDGSGPLSGPIHELLGFRRRLRPSAG